MAVNVLGVVSLKLASWSQIIGWIKKVDSFGRLRDAVARRRATVVKPVIPHALPVPWFKW